MESSKLTPFLNAVIDRLATLGDVYYRDAVKYDDSGVETDLEYPYWLVWPADARPGVEQPLSGQGGDVSVVVAVTSVGTTPMGASIAADNARALLGVDRWQTLQVPDCDAVIRWQSQVGGAVDRDVKLPNTNRHPSYEVDFYKVLITPSN
jgi:hypothetical protein